MFHSLNLMTLHCSAGLPGTSWWEWTTWSPWKEGKLILNKRSMPSWGTLPLKQTQLWMHLFCFFLLVPVKWCSLLTILKNVKLLHVLNLLHQHMFYVLGPCWNKRTRGTSRREGNQSECILKSSCNLISVGHVLMMDHIEGFMLELLIFVWHPEDDHFSLFLRF